jgi:hypothetical protein
METSVAEFGKISKQAIVGDAEARLRKACTVIQYLLHAHLMRLKPI